MVAAAEGLADGLQGAGELAGQVDGHLARPGDPSRAAAEVSCSERELKWAATTVGSRRSWAARSGGGGIHGVEDLGCELGSIGAAVSEWKATTRISAPSSARMLSGDPLGDQLQHRGVGDGDVVEGRALAQDRHARGESGGLMSATRPASKRSRSRCSIATSARGAGRR